MKLYRNIIIVAFVIAALVASLFFISKYQPEKEPESTETPVTEGMLQIYQTDGKSICGLHIKNDSEEYTLSLLSNGQWVLNNDSSIRLKQTSVAALVNTCASVAAKKVVAETMDDAEAFGLAAPASFVKLQLSDGATKTIYVGNKTLDGQDYYISLSDDTNIYLKNAYGTESIIPKIHSLRNLQLIAIDTGDLNAIQSFMMSVQDKMNIKIENLQEAGWKMTSPVYADAKGQILVNEIFSKFENFEAAYVIEDHTKDLSKYGLLKPYAEFSLVTDDNTYHFLIGNETNQHRFIKEKGRDTVYVLPVSTLSFLDIAYMDLMSSLIHVEYITEISMVEIATDKEKIVMHITGEGDSAQYQINGKTMQKNTFSKLYQDVIGIYLDSVDLTKAPNIKPDAYIQYTKKDGSITRVEFLPINDRNYRVIIDGKGNAVTNKKNLNNVIEKIQNALENLS